MGRWESVLHQLAYIRLLTDNNTIFLQLFSARSPVVQTHRSIASNARIWAIIRQSAKFAQLHF